MSAPRVGELKREILDLCDRHGVSREDLRNTCGAILEEEGLAPRAVFRATEEDDAENERNREED